MGENTDTVLIVDDDSTVRRILAENLARNGFKTFQAEDGEEAVALAINNKPKIIIADIVMPKMDGWDLCKTLRSLPSTKFIPFVFLSSLDKTPDKIMGIKLGADDYLTKPFSADEVVFKLKAIMRRIKQRNKLLETHDAEADDATSLAMLSDVIEYLRHTKRTGLLAVYGPSSKGVIYIQAGATLHASIGTLTGERAVYEIFNMKIVQVKYLEKECPELPENLTMTWEELMPRVLKKHSLPETS